MAYVQILCICYMTSGINESQKIFKIDFVTVSILNIIPKLFLSCPVDSSIFETNYIMY